MTSNCRMSSVKSDETYWQVISLVNKKKLADAYVDLLRKTDHDMTAMINEGVATEADGLSVKVKLNEAEMAQTKVDNGAGSFPHVNWHRYAGCP